MTNSTEEIKFLAQGLSWKAWDKPTGVSVHNEAPSMLDLLKKANPNANFHFLNRLDRETSGIVVTTENAETVQNLQKVWMQPETLKIYVGLHRKGKKEVLLKPQIWTERLTDQAEGRKNPQGISANRIDCKTEMIPLIVGEHLVFSALILHTGRQHQIRRHSVLHGLELIGDKRYGDSDYFRKMSQRFANLRLGLHAAALFWKPEEKQLLIRAVLPAFYQEVFPDSESKLEIFLESYR